MFSRTITTRKQVETNPEEVLAEIGMNPEDIRLFVISGGTGKLKAAINAVISVGDGDNRIMAARFKFLLGAVNSRRGRAVRILGSLTGQDRLVPIDQKPKDYPEGQNWTPNAAIKAVYPQALEALLQDRAEKGWGVETHATNRNQGITMGTLIEPKKTKKDTVKLSELFEIGAEAEIKTEEKEGSKDKGAKPPM